MNFVGTFALTKALIPLIAKNNGRIANVTVPSEISPYWHPLAYVASKAAQNAMMGVMAIEFQQAGTPVEIFVLVWAPLLHFCYGFSSGQPSAVHVMGRWMSMAAPFCLAL